ncbi:hypothetical protein FLAG1_07256 [Fusarium langsethiae]|uniref:Uncharacterized protein n=1 Tax=Fusarium langsethiae TaxID=179993 RepID=A0A0M9EUE2_FUSLA|nr:hypothetical protein FLAG1_07256 [Fusarium langsethiae]GKU04614.1 unnamed protein product [Fusarium langsethiae]GKU20088.1 unnamed protein product [Fusarium langsethiae]
MYPDSESHSRTLECIACSQLCVWQETEWVCNSCRRVHRRIPIDNESLDQGETPSTAHDGTDGSDDELAAGDHPTTMVTRDGTPEDFHALRASGGGQLGYNQNEGDSMVSPSHINADQGSRESCDAEQNGQGWGQVIGDPDRNVDPMNVDNNDEEVYQPQAPVPFWMSGVANTCVGERHSDIEYTIRRFNLAFHPEAPSETPTADDELELSDNTEMDE